MASPRLPSSHAMPGQSRRLSTSRRLSASILPPEDALGFASTFDNIMFTSSSSSSSNGTAYHQPAADVTATANGTRSTPAPSSSSIRPQLAATTQFSTTSVLGGATQSSPTSASPTTELLSTTTTPPSPQPQRTNSTATIRARKPSLSRIPTSSLIAAPSSSSNGTTYSTSPTSSSPSSSSPTSVLKKEVGLGLMLDEEAALPGSRSGSSTDLYGKGGGSSTSGGARSVMSRFGLGGGGDGRGGEEEDYSVSGGPSGSSRLLNGGGEGAGGPGDVSSPTSSSSAASDWGSFERPSSPIPPRSSSSTIPRLSTTGGSSSPLLVYTGTPLLSPRTNSFSSASSSYNNNPPIHRAPSPSRFLVQSVPMDRSGSGSMSRNSSDVHSRHQSLTSACPPATSSVGTSTPSIGVVGTNGVASSEFYHPPSSPNPAKGWKVYDWGSPSSTSGSPSKLDDHKPLKPHPSSSRALSTITSLINLPTTLLAFFLAPLTSSYHPAPTLSASTTPTSSSSSIGTKRYPFPIRLLTVAYLIFSCVFLAARLTSPDGEARLGAGMRIGPRGGGGTGTEGLGVMDARGEYGDKYMVGGWAQKVAEGVRWGAGYKEVESQSTEEVVGEKLVEVKEEMLNVSEVDEGWGTVRRIGSEDPSLRTPDMNPLTTFTHTYRLAKMHDKIHWDLHDEIEPYIFRATGTPPDKEDVTACLYSNEAWLSTLPSFVSAWGGPVSLVFEADHSRSSPRRVDLLESINSLRKTHEHVRLLVDFHLVGAPSSMGERTLNKTRERMILKPIAQNFHVNLARFFAPTDIVYIVGDPRIVPSRGLRSRLQSTTIHDLVVQGGDAVVVPTFGFVRNPTGEAVARAQTPNDIRNRVGNPRAGQWVGIGESEFDVLAQEHVQQLQRTLPLLPEQWPQKKAALVGLVRTRVGTPDRPSDSTLALFDRKWDLNHGPTNWYLWRKSSTDARLLEPPELGGGIGLGPKGGVGGGKDVFRVTDYDLHFSPSVVVSKRGQPWCTERFESLTAACVYQMYLAGAEMWVLPDEWAFTIEAIDKVIEPAKEDPAEKLKKSISSRLYGKFHQEACMHYGREFLSVQMWNSDKAQHLRSVCARTLGTWGMGDNS